MYRFILFIKKVYVLLLFIVLEATALHFYSNSTNYTKAKLLTVSNSAVGSFYGTISGITSYFGLRKENDRLVDQIVELRNQLEGYRTADSPIVIDSLGATLTNDYFYTSATVVNNSISRKDNHIAIDKGARDGIEPGMAITSVDGAIAGYIVKCSEKFSVGMSILNSSFRSSGRIGNSEWYGPIYWDGTSHQYITLTDIPKYATLQRGDTILTTNYSSIFPPQMKIGQVESFALNESLLYDVKVRVFAPMASLNKVLIIKYQDAYERKHLEAEVGVMSDEVQN